MLHPCSSLPLAAKLRPSNVDPAAGALEEVQRVIKKIRQQWNHSPELITFLDWRKIAV
ncbi:hypothetical protein [Nostoc sp. NMS8]|uniref:hypothetical protein n=1 Tax=Nostoc sp. NMS8 TaxID=2815392 RepID=UPI0025DFE298|nr:hypothetical protein [Nostoc sp. NMS8]MBN3960174.1 hypothetical protein [Nostoc sp. NMS8]